MDLHSQQVSWSLSKQQLATTSTVDGEQLRFLQEDTTGSSSSSSTTSTTTTTTNSYNDGQILKNTFLVFGILFLLILLLFCWARRRFPRVYNLRSNSDNSHWMDDDDDDDDDMKTPLAQEQHGFFSWLWKVHNVTDDVFLNECGMDALCSARVLRVGFKLRYVRWYVLASSACTFYCLFQIVQDIVEWCSSTVFY
jgi:preprotein translocase subunit SecG